MTMNQASCIIYMSLLVSIAGAAESNIVAGKVAKPHSKPYMASLQFNGIHSCGGILIREDFVLTAAHCKQSQKMVVVLGGHNISAAENTQQRVEVAEYHQYPKFRELEYEYDIMLLKLKKKVRLNKYVKTIGIPNKNGKTPANISCVVAGWGKTGDGKPSDVLRETTEKTQFSFECKNIWGKFFNSAHMICTKIDRKKGGVCQGDSGGPLICNKKVEGITAYTSGENCSHPKHPHVFTKVNYFSSWIKKVMKKIK